jgi:flagellar protein FlaJ
MREYLEILYYQIIKRNVIILRKLGRNVDDKKFAVFLFLVLIVSILLSLYFELTLRGSVFLIFVYLGAAIHLPTVMYENKIERLEQNIPEALYVMVLALEAGRSINEALEDVVKNDIKEVSIVFRKILYLMEKQRMSFEESITIVSNLYDSRILRMLARTVVENMKSGGNLSESLKTLAKTLVDLQNYKRQLLSVIAGALAVGFIILCGVIPAVTGLLGGYMIVVTKSMSGFAPIPPVTKEDIIKGLEIIEMGTAVVGAFFSIPVYGIKIPRMFLASSVVMTISMAIYYEILKKAPGLFGF